MLINNYGDISLIGKAVVLKTTSNHVKVMCQFESDFFLYDTDTKKRRLDIKS